MTIEAWADLGRLSRPFLIAIYGAVHYIVHKENMRVIKRYSNRRLYDTEDSKYITLVRVAELAKNREQFKVIDTESGKDLTRSVLLQIIVEQEGSDQAILSADSLSELIGYYGNTVPSLFNEYLQNSLKSFSEGQHQLCSQFNADSMKVFEKMATDNMDMWRSVQENFLKMSGFKPGEQDENGKDWSNLATGESGSHKQSPDYKSTISSQKLFSRLI